VSTWTILIATIGQRRDLLARLLDGLMPQVDAAGGRVNVLAYWDSGQLTRRLRSALDAIAHKRQALLDAAKSDYVSWLDDDDWVAEDYIASILEALDQRPDMVSFTMEVRKDGRPHQLGRISLRYGGWSQAPDGTYLRDITHANPIRAEIARTASFLKRGGGPEDVAWVSQLRAGGLLRTEVVIDKVLQHYDWVVERSSWTVPGRVVARDPNGQPWQRLEVDSPHFAYLDA
jgi:glycosyl transferase family 2